jgi:hypothetical protein
MRTEIRENALKHTQLKRLNITGALANIQTLRPQNGRLNTRGLDKVAEQNNIDPGRKSYRRKQDNSRHENKGCSQE